MLQEFIGVYTHACKHTHTHALAHTHKLGSGIPEYSLPSKGNIAVLSIFYYLKTYKA